MAASEKKRSDVPYLMHRPGLRPRASVLAVAAALVATSCSVLPPSLRKQEPTKTITGATEVTAPPATSMQPPPPQSAQQPNRLYSGTGVFVNQTPPAPPPPPGPEEASLNFESLDVREVAKVILGDYLHESYTVHPSVQGTVTFRTIRPIPMRDLLATLEMLLRQNGAAVVKEAGIYKILPVAQVRGSVSPQLGGGNRPLPPGFSVVVVPLKFIGAKEMQKLLEPFAADNTVRIDETRNLVIMAGGQRELRHLVDTIDLFDVDWLAGYSVGLFPVRSGDVKALMGDLDKVFGAAAQGPLAGVMRIIPIERLNALFIVTTQPKYLETARTWIERLDQGGATAGGTRFFVYQVRNGKAENLAQLVGDLFASRRTTTSAPTLAPGARPTEIRSTPFGQTQPPPQTTTTTVTPPPGAAAFQIPGAGGTTTGEVRVIADKDTNSLLILASPSDYEVIESALRRLDVVPRQVLVEVALVEVTLTDSASLGVGWFINARNNTTGRLGTGLPDTPAGTVAPPSGASANALQLIQRTATGDIRAVVNALGTDGKTKVLAAPQVMVLDNQKAQIKIGNRISVQTQSQSVAGTTTGLVNSFQYLETGVLLAVTPRINSGGLVTLEVNQEVSVPGDTPPGNPNPNVNSRSAQTTVVVGSGETIVLGGLIREDDTRGTSGLPLLSKIPILGAAFGSQNFSHQRIELILVITPHIVSDTTQAREATEELRKKMPALEGTLPKPAKVHMTPTDVMPPPGAVAPTTVPPVQVAPPPAGATLPVPPPAQVIAPPPGATPP
ncbi:MAG TPA: type II secretion system secretin GspD, partial [Usitatibacter sp.]|nr:type II secretion system secretin GspD [Usitatibacter sp.]